MEVSWTHDTYPGIHQYIGIQISESARVSARFANVEGNAFGIEVHSGGLAELALSGASISNNGTGVKVLLDEDENEVKATIDIFSSLIGNNNGHGFEGGGTVVIRSSTIFSMGNLV